MCSSGWHGRAVPARPARGCLGKSSPERQRWHEEQPHLGCFDSHLHSHHLQHSTTATPYSPRRRCRRQEVAGEVLGSVATGRRKPEWSQASDLLGEETAGKSARRRRERVKRGAFCPRWWRWNLPESARIARRRRRRFRVRRRESRGEGCEGEAGLGRFDRPRSWPVGLDPAGLVGPGQWAQAHLQIKLSFKNLKFCFSFLN
jgi:hypothetical protein